MNISRLRLGFLIAAVAGGTWLGYQARFHHDGGGFSFMASLAAMVFSGLILAVLAIFALVSARQPDGEGGATARATVVAGAVFFASFALGWVVALTTIAPRS